MGVGVREGAPRPDISTPEAFKQTLLAAKSLVYVDPAQGATSGIHFASVLDRLGIAEAVRGKTQLVPGGYPAEKVASGEAELVVHQISEIVPVKGVVLMGRCPRSSRRSPSTRRAWPRAARSRRPPAPSSRSWCGRPSRRSSPRRVSTTSPERTRRRSSRGAMRRRRRGIVLSVFASPGAIAFRVGAAHGPLVRHPHGRPSICVGFWLAHRQRDRGRSSRGRHPARGPVGGRRRAHRRAPLRGARSTGTTTAGSR